MAIAYSYELCVVQKSETPFSPRESSSMVKRLRSSALRRPVVVSGLSLSSPIQKQAKQDMFLTAFRFSLFCLF